MLLNSPNDNENTLVVASYIVYFLFLVNNAYLLKNEINTAIFQYTEKFHSSFRSTLILNCSEKFIHF